MRSREVNGGIQTVEGLFLLPVHDIREMTVTYHNMHSSFLMISPGLTPGGRRESG